MLGTRISSVFLRPVAGSPDGLRWRRDRATIDEAFRVSVIGTTGDWQCVRGTVTVISVQLEEEMVDR